MKLRVIQTFHYGGRVFLAGDLIPDDLFDKFNNDAHYIGKLVVRVPDTDSIVKKP